MKNKFILGIESPNKTFHPDYASKTEEKSKNTTLLGKIC